jgi:hypothetical protein
MRVKNKQEGGTSWADAMSGHNRMGHGDRKGRHYERIVIILRLFHAHKAISMTSSS